MIERVAERRRTGRQEPPSHDDQRTGRGRLDPRRLLLGAKSGAIATVVMTVFRMPLAESLPPTADFWARYVAGGRPEDHPLAGLLLHLVYGTVAGALFAGFFRSPTVGTEAGRERDGVLLGVGYALALSLFGERVLLAGLLDMDLAPDERFVFHVGHVVYGLTLGAWTGSRSDRAPSGAVDDG